MPIMTVGLHGFVEKSRALYCPPVSGNCHEIEMSVFVDQGSQPLYVTAIPRCQAEHSPLQSGGAA
jgi:hypothetical protein